MWRWICPFLCLGLLVFIGLWVRNILQAFKSGKLQAMLEAKKRENILRDMDEDIQKELKREPVAEPDKPQFIGRVRGGWILVTATSAPEVADAIGLTDQRPCNWMSAAEICSALFNQRTWVSPPVDGVVIVRGLLPGATLAEPRRGLWELLERLSARFGDAQFYQFNRTITANAWARAEKGNMTRAYMIMANDDELIWNDGAITEGERAAGVVYGESGRKGKLPPGPEGERDVCLMEEAVEMIAAKWSSLDLDTIDKRDLPPSTGIIGKLPSHLTAS
jgi:hypothetical protein